MNINVTNIKGVIAKYWFLIQMIFIMPFQKK